MWLEIGVDGLSPVDRGAGMDPVAIRREYGPEVILIGGIDRAVLERGREDIELEVMSNAPTLFAQGRYIPAGDAHFAITKMVSFDNMRYYVDALRRAASL
jgi:uroporphyrinogen decarboxylase